MNPNDPKQDAALQHEAEHTRGPKKSPVTLYLTILFGAAFLLLLLSFFMQQRTNEAAMDQLQQTSNSAVESLENLLSERDELVAERDSLLSEKTTLSLENARVVEEKAALEAEKAQLEQDILATGADSDQLRDNVAAAEAQRDALKKLNHIRALYNQHRAGEAHDLLVKWEAEAPGQLEANLSLISQGMDPADREVYDPLAAYRKLVGYIMK